MTNVSTRKRKKGLNKEALKAILIGFVQEMYTFGHFMSQQRAEEAVKEIKKLS